MWLWDCKFTLQGKRFRYFQVAVTGSHYFRMVKKCLCFRFCFFLFCFVLFSIGHFRVPLCLCFKMSLSAKPFLRKLVLCAVSFHANQSHFHKNGFALSLALKQRDKGTRKWPFNITDNTSSQCSVLQSSCSIHMTRGWEQKLSLSVASSFWWVTTFKRTVTFMGLLL